MLKTFKRSPASLPNLKYKKNYALNSSFSVNCPIALYLA